MRRMPRDYLRRNDARAGRTGDLAECYPAPGPKEGVGVKKTHNPDSVRHGFRDGGTRNMQDGGMMAKTLSLFGDSGNSAEIKAALKT